jgi:hypothetical protein
MHPEEVPMLRRVSCLGLAGALLLTAGAVRGQEKADVQVVKYPGLAGAVLKNKGKVVLVDFWDLY